MATYPDNLCSFVIAAYEAKYSERSTAKHCLIIDSVFDEQPVTKPANQFYWSEDTQEEQLPGKLI